MKKNYFVLLAAINLFILICIIFSNSSFAQTEKGKRGTLIFDEQSNSGKINDNVTDYNLELLPSQSFTGWFYYFSNGTPVTASLSESPNVSWLSVSPTAFTSSSCSDIKAVAFSFTAPSSVGTYTTTVLDLNNNWTEVPVTLNVTNNPTLNLFDSTVTINPGQSAQRFQNSAYTPFTGFGCAATYAPAGSLITSHILVPNVSWMNISPASYSVNLNSSVTAVKTFSSNTVGSYSTLEVRTKQYFSYPIFIRWHLNVNSSTSGQYSLQFNGANNYVVTPNSSSINSISTNNKITIESWIKIEGFPYDYFNIIDKQDCYYLEYDRNISKMTFVYAGVGQSEFPFNPVLNTWYHVAFTFDGATNISKFYINGVYVSQSNFPIVLTSSTSNLYIANGITGSQEYPKGKLDELRLWNKVRTATEIAQNYNVSFTTPQTGLVLNYRFNEGTGSITSDLSGNGNTGTLVNNPFWSTDVPPLTAINLLSTKLPESFSMSQNYPNPFNPVTNIKFEIPKNEFVNIKVFDIVGREVKELVNQNMPAGEYKVDFNGTGLESGIYFYRINAGDFVETKKMILVK